jgi:hypothetical protein
MSKLYEQIMHFVMIHFFLVFLSISTTAIDRLDLWHFGQIRIGHLHD